jgi:hypothetical protein
MKAKKAVKRKKQAKVRKKKRMPRKKSGKEIMLDKLKKSDYLGGEKIVFEHPGLEKMSEVILRFAEPLLDEAKTDKELKRAVEVAIIAWNTSLFPEEKQIAAIKEMADSIPEQSGDFTSIMYFLVERRKKYFSEYYDRMIVSHHVSVSNANISLDVATTKGS